MRLPIDTSRLQFLVVAEAEEQRRFEEGMRREEWSPRVDENGELLSGCSWSRSATEARRSFASLCPAIRA
jgi:hypothetical protein